MTFFDVLSLVGGIALFLYGMDVLGKSLEKAAGSQLKSILSKLTNSTIKGLLLGVAVTAVIQSSAATTVMVVGFVNSGLMQLGQAVGVIMGANIGTTVTAWLVVLFGISFDIDLAAVPAMEDMTLTELLYSESASRLIVSVRPDLAMILDMLGSWQICRRIGTVTDDNTLTMTRGGVTVLQESVDDLTTAFKRTLDW